MTQSKTESKPVQLPDFSGFIKGVGGVSSQVVNTFKRYSEIEVLGKEWSYRYSTLIHGIDNPLLARLVASGIPLSAALSLVLKLLSDCCRLLDTLGESIRTGEFAIGNVPLFLVDAMEYLRQLMGIILGVFVAWYSPQLAARSFLTNPVDPSIEMLTPKETAQLYSMVNALHQFFIEHKIDYRICCGTALGAQREGGIIRNDDDIDLMLHPDSVDAFRNLVNQGIFTEKTGIAIQYQPWTGGWQSFYKDSPKGVEGSPLETIGKPFIDVFAGVWRKKGNQQIISYGVDRMYNLFRSEYFTQEEWAETPKLYTFGPTKLLGIESMEAYLIRCYGPLALRYTAVEPPHEAYEKIYKSPLRVFSILAQHPLPCYMRHEKAMPVQYDEEEYSSRTLQNHVP